MTHRLSALCCLLALFGCAQRHVITINTKPADALIRIDNVDRGRGQVVYQFVFNSPSHVHTVVASRPGYKDATATVTVDYDRKDLPLELRPVSKLVNISVQPAAIISVDGKPIDNQPVTTISKELEFTLDSKRNWNTHTITAERANFLPDTVLVSWTDKEPTYTLNLRPMKKSVSVTTNPPGAQVLLDFQKLGVSPVNDVAVDFPVDPDTNEFRPRKLRAEKAGYDPVTVDMSWDNGKRDYHVDLLAKTKTIRFRVDPPGASVKLEAADVPPDSNGIPSVTVQFPPIDENGNLKTYSATISRKTADSEWVPQTMTIAWENGRSDYTVSLKEVLTRPVKLLSAVMQRSDEGWTVEPQWTDTIAMKDITEGSGKPSPLQLTRLAKGTQIGSLAVAPDGSRILFTVLVADSGRAGFHSQILAIKTDGSGGADLLSDGQSLDLMPSSTPGGEQVLFSSNRGGKRMNIWSMSAFGAPGVTRLTSGDTNDLWPTIDSDPKPRLFYQVMIDTRPDPRVYMTQRGTIFQTDLTSIAGTQPRVSPKNDAILFAAVNEKTGKRDIYRMSDLGGAPDNLTNTPDADDFDPAWSKDGSKIVFTSDQSADNEGRHHYDVWMLDLTKPQEPQRITTNASHDDSPVFDIGGNGIFFRSNRGGQWQIWRIALK